MATVIARYDDGDERTGYASAAVVGGRFVSVSGDRVAGNISYATTSAGAKAHGVARTDAAITTTFPVSSGSSKVVQVQATNATIAAGADVEVGANGMAQTKNTGIAVGYAVQNCAANGLAEISLYV